MDEQDLIRDQMENTRSALSEKLEILEDRVTSTVEVASQGVAETVETVTDSVQETVEAVKETVEDTLGAVKEGMSAVKSMLDVPAHVQAHPWLFLGGSVACGFVLGEYLRPRSAPAPREEVPSHIKPRSNGSHTAPHGNGRAVSAPPDESTSESVMAQFAPEIARLKGLAVSVLLGTVREMVTQSVGHELGKSLGEIIDSVTEKMGGKPISAEGLGQSSEAEIPTAALDEESSQPTSAKVAVRAGPHFDRMAGRIS